MLKHSCNIIPWISWKTYLIGESLETLIYEQRSTYYYLLNNQASIGWNKLINNGLINEDEILQLSLLFVDGIISSDYIPLYDETYCLIIKSMGIPIDFCTRIKHEGYVFDAHWDITNKCNAKCIHCYNIHAQDGTRNTYDDELSYEEAITMVDEIHKLGVFRLVLSGGEALTKSYIISLCDYIRRKNISLIIYTNGILLTSQNIKKLSELSPTSICISVYGACGKVHDSITQIKGSYSKVLNGLIGLRNCHIKACHKNTLLSLNYEVWKETYEKGCEISDNSMINLIIYPSMDDGKLTQYALNDNQLLELALHPDSPIYYKKKINSVCTIHKDSDKSPCYDMTNQIYITPNGDIFPCIAFPCKIGSLKEKNIQSLKRFNFLDKFNGDFSCMSYSERLDNWRSLKIRDLKDCGKYNYCSFCIDVCPGDAFIMRGDFLVAPENHCRIAKARCKAYKLSENKISD